MTADETILNELPDPGSARHFLDRLAQDQPSHYGRLQRDPALLSDILAIVSYSPLLATTLLQNPEYIWWLKRKRGDNVVRNKEELLESLARFSLTNSQVEPNVMLARFRRRELLRIYLRDIRNLATIAEITEEISNLADAVLEHALRLAYQELTNRYGQPLAEDKKGRKTDAQFCIISLGKLGSRELNYASDIDLLFLYSDEGVTSEVGSRGSVTNREFYVKLAEGIVKLIGGQSGEGAAYRVDLRLRPHGRVGPLALSFEDTVRYYKQEAAAWERQVLIRSRSSAGVETLFRRFYSRCEATVYSEQITVEEALRNVRESKQKIDLDRINAKGIDVKLGRGGIREIEFISQALQLAYGGRDRWLRSPHTLISLARLADRKLISENELTALSDAYAFLRQLEHILQMENGLQTHRVPDDPDRLEILAKRMAFRSTDDLNAELESHTSGVRSIFERVFDTGRHEEDESNRTDALHQEIGYPSTVLAEPDEDHFYDPELAKLREIAPRFGELLDAEPALADEIFPLRDVFPERDHAARLLDAVSSTDSFGAAISELRREWHRCIAEIIAYDASQKIDLARSKRLQSDLAEAAMSAALHIADRELHVRFGDAVDGVSIAVMGLGKLGGAGLDHDSDLDLVIVYDDTSSEKKSDPTPAEIADRTVEIFVNALSAVTRDGSLYRVDLRLRPHGKDGRLSIYRSAFVAYMRSTAAIWELLAFVKLRGVGGNIELAQSVEQEIREVIHEKALRIGPQELAAETVKIRRALEDARAGNRRGRNIDIKYGEGGLLDIYFAIRFLQLRDNVPDTKGNRSTGQTLVRLKENGSLTDALYDKLSRGYRFLSLTDHYLRLTVGRTTRMPLANQKSLAILTSYLGLPTPAGLIETLAAHRLDIRSAYEEILGESKQ